MGRDRPFENARKLIKRYRITQGEKKAEPETGR